MNNLDPKTVSSFGDEWSHFDQSRMTNIEKNKTFSEYFKIFPWDDISTDAEGFDMGCGSGRWAQFVAPLVGRLHCIDPSSSIEVAKLNLSNFENCIFHKSSVSDVLLPPSSQDFGYSLGVLHHVPDTTSALKSCASLLKTGAPFLLYMYYALENRPFWYKILWTLSDKTRKVIIQLNPTLKLMITNLIAFLVYLPFSKISLILEKLGFKVTNIPLSYYRHHSFYTMRTDSRDRFGTPLEKRFSRSEIFKMMTDAGFEKIHFSEYAPYWCAVGFKK